MPRRQVAKAGKLPSRAEVTGMKQSMKPVLWASCAVVAAMFCCKQSVLTSEEPSLTTVLWHGDDECESLLRPRCPEVEPVELGIDKSLVLCAVDEPEDFDLLRWLEAEGYVIYARIAEWQLQSTHVSSGVIELSALTRIGVTKQLAKRQTCDTGFFDPAKNPKLNNHCAYACAHWTAYGTRPGVAEANQMRHKIARAWRRHGEELLRHAEEEGHGRPWRYLRDHVLPRRAGWGGLPEIYMFESIHDLKVRVVDINGHTLYANIQEGEVHAVWLHHCSHYMVLETGCVMTARDIHSQRDQKYPMPARAGMPSFLVNLDEEEPLVELSMQFQGQVYCLACRRWKEMGHDEQHERQFNVRSLLDWELPLRQRILQVRRHEVHREDFVIEQPMQEDQLFARVHAGWFCLGCMRMAEWNHAQDPAHRLVVAVLGDVPRQERAQLLARRAQRSLLMIPEADEPRRGGMPWNTMAIDVPYLHGLAVGCYRGGGKLVLKPKKEVEDEDEISPRHRPPATWGDRSSGTRSERKPSCDLPPPRPVPLTTSLQTRTGSSGSHERRATNVKEERRREEVRTPVTRSHRAQAVGHGEGEPASSSRSSTGVATGSTERQPLRTRDPGAVRDRADRQTLASSASQGEKKHSGHRRHELDSAGVADSARSNKPRSSAISPQPDRCEEDRRPARASTKRPREEAGSSTGRHNRSDRKDDRREATHLERWGAPRSCE